MGNGLLFRLRALFRRNRVEEELDNELQFHLEEQVEKYVRSGMSREQAVRKVRMDFGGLTQIKENCREERSTDLLETSLQDLRYGWRLLWKNPGFTIIAALTLALGIGASISVFSVVSTILLKPLPYPDIDRLMVLWRRGPTETSISATGDWPWSARELHVLLQTDKAFQNLGGFKKSSFNLTGANNPELLEGVRVSAGFFPALGASPLLGRTLTADDDQPGHEYVAVLSHRLWQTHFGGDTGIVGKVVDLNGHPYTVVGVMGENFTFPNTDGIPALLDVPKETQLWVPLALPASNTGPNEFGVIGRLKPNVGFAQAQQGMNVFEKQLVEQFPQIKGWSTRIAPLAQQVVSEAQHPLLLLLGAVSVVLLIACSNVAGLTLNRSLGRRRELTLRGALGAGRKRLIRQLMTEGLLLSFVGGALGTLLGEATIYGIKHFGPKSIPHIQEIGMDLRVLAFALGITLVTGVLFGLAPAVGTARLNMVEALKEGGQRSGGSATAPKIRNVLLIAQVALALVLVVSAGLLVRTFLSMLHANAGFDAVHVVTFELPLPSPKYGETEHGDTDRMARLYQQVLLRLQSIPGVQSAGFTSVVPMGGAPDGSMLRIPEHVTPPGTEAPWANYSFVSPSYFAAIGTPLLRGRDIADADTLSSMPVTIINSAMAKKFFSGEDPIGKQVGVQTPRYPVRTIIGVVADIKHASLREEPAPEMYVPYTQNEIKIWPSMQAMQFAIRSKSDPALLTESIRLAVHAVDPDLPVAKLSLLTTLVDSSLTIDRMAMLLVSAFGALALILSSIGMYGVISYSVSQRTQEIGVRIALGAQRRTIFAMVLGQGSRLAGIGIGIGLITALGVTRLMTGFLYGVKPADLTTFFVVSLLLILVALLACYIPARKAMKVDPMIALRYE